MPEQSAAERAATTGYFAGFAAADGAALARVKALGAELQRIGRVLHDRTCRTKVGAGLQSWYVCKEAICVEVRTFLLEEEAAGG